MCDNCKDQNSEESLKMKLRFIQAELAHHIERHAEEKEELHSKLDMILEQARKTNGRTTKLEDEVHRLDVQSAQHLVNCPNAAKIDVIKNGLLEYNFLQKHPGAIYFAVGVMVVLILASLLLFYIQIKKELIPQQIVEPQTINKEQHETRIADTRIERVFRY